MDKLTSKEYTAMSERLKIPNEQVVVSVTVSQREAEKNCRRS